MVNSYVYRIKTGRMTVEQVPEKYRKFVIKILERGKNIREKKEEDRKENG